MYFSHCASIEKLTSKCKTTPAKPLSSTIVEPVTTTNEYRLLYSLLTQPSLVDYRRLRNKKHSLQSQGTSLFTNYTWTRLYITSGHPWTPHVPVSLYTLATVVGMVTSLIPISVFVARQLSLLVYVERLNGPPYFKKIIEL